MKKRILSLLLCAAMLVGMIPAGTVTALAAEPDAETLSDAYISVSVSKKNGGFAVTTVEGDRLKKSDNDKKLLYHDGQYDTSFLSLRVGEGEGAKDYLFGGEYTGSSDVAVTKSAAGDSIAAVWSVDGLTFTQTITLANQESAESGMVSITLSVKNGSGSDKKVQARLLLDTCLGEQDFGYYQYAENTNTQTVSAETVLTSGIPATIYASDDPLSPAVVAYTTHTGATPTKVAFGHWSHLASTLFDFTPLATLDFTNTRSEYATADSAYALYYDLGTVASGGTGGVSTYYGVRSNRAAAASDSVAVNATAPVKLSLNEAKTDFVRQSDQGIADFSVTVDFTNIASETAQELKSIQLVVRTGSGLRSLSDTGEAINGYGFTSTEPFTASYSDVAVGATTSKTLYFEAKPDAEATYERITIGVYDVSDGGALSETNKLGERIVYILLPGTQSDVPKISFTAMSPSVVYSEGTRHLFVTVGQNVDLINVDAGNRKWKLYVVSESEKNPVEHEIDHANISFKDGVMDVAITEEIQLAEGGWYLELRWGADVVGNGTDKIVPEEYKNQTAPVLHFTVSSDIKYKNDSYGILAVVEFAVKGTSYASKIPATAIPDPKMYRILTFADEADFADYKANPTTYKKADGTTYYSDYGKYTEIIFVLKGEFSISKRLGTSGSATYYTAISKKVTATDGSTSISNPILINNCLDFEDGTLSVYYENYAATGAAAFDSAVTIEFDGKLYTNGARTSVWSGKGFFTQLEQYTDDYSLAPYDENGNRISIFEQGGTLHAGDEDDFGDTAVCLIWPMLAGEIGQTLSGLVFHLAYGQMGVMYDTESQSNKIEKEIGTVVSFAASLDLSFATGHVAGKEENEDYFVKLQRIWGEYKHKDSPIVNGQQFAEAYEAINWRDIEEGDDESEKRVSASVMVRDVVFGCGQGFIGVNFTASVGLQNYISSLPAIQGKISINTINDWAFGVEGEVDLEVFKLEAEISFKSKNNVPVPDNFYVFVSGIEPGINIDGCGVIWITGGGGGINNLYDTIFCTKAVPPLKLVMSISFDILALFECEKATLSVGLTGVSLTAEGIGMAHGIYKNIIPRMGLSLEWYPGIDLQASIRLNLLQGVVQGGGYIVLKSPDYQDVFFEMFARAELLIPGSIPIVGGMKLAGVDLGLSTEKIWGAIKVLCFTLGATYYWGDDSISFGDGTKAEPTFPSLLGYDDIPLGRDEQTGQTLYLRIGTNTALMASNLDDDGTLVLLGTGATLRSNENKSRHQFNLGAKGSSDALVQIVFDATSLADAEQKAAQIRVGSKTDYSGSDYTLTRYVESKNNAATANANLTYDEGTGKATFAFSVTQSGAYQKDWYMTTPAGSDVLLYNVAQMPEVKTVSGSISGSALDVSWTGESLGDLDQISFYLSSSTDPAADPGYRIDVVDTAATLSGGSATLAIPADVPSGEYYIRAVYSKENEVNGTAFSSTKLTWANPNTPGEVRYTAKAAGNLQYKLTIADGDADGYFVTVYESDGTTATDFAQVSYDAAASGTTTILVGGSYQSTGENGQNAKTVGLTGGKSYVIGVTPYKLVSSSAVRGAEVKTSAIALPRSVTPTVTFSANQTKKTRTETMPGENGTSQTVTQDVYTTGDLTFTAKISESATGTWSLNGGDATSFTGSTVTIPLTGLADGAYTLTVEGAALDGDSFSSSCCFTVDTLPPQLLLSSPVNGSFFSKDGKVTFTGVTDADARFTITCDGVAICTKKSIAALDTDFAGGQFEFTVAIPDPNSASQRTLTISVCDDVGNATTAETLTLSHGGLADLQSLEISVDGYTYQQGNVPIPAFGLTNAQLALVGVTSDNIRFRITGGNVLWEARAVEGSASVTDSGAFTAVALSQGTITAKLAVAEGSGVTAARTATLCFGAPGAHCVSVSQSIGGSVTGGGEYEPGETVTLTATADSGYRFAGWTIVGASVADTAAATITFSMPQSGNVTVIARFEPTASGDGLYATAGSVVRVRIPSGVSASGYLPCYTNEKGETVFVPIAAEENGEMVFLAPVSTTYRFSSNPQRFADTTTHWARSSIEFCAERGIFQGVTSTRFSPDASMTRAMFAAVLYRLAGEPAVSGTSTFADVQKGRYYYNAVLWGESTGIMKGFSDGSFGVNRRITREQMCVLLVRYLEWAGYDLPATQGAQRFTDASLLGTWSADAVSYCQTRGLIYGRTSGAFDPKSNATRAQNCAVFERTIRAILASQK